MLPYHPRHALTNPDPLLAAIGGACRDSWEARLHHELYGHNGLLLASELGQKAGLAAHRPPRYRRGVSARV